MCLQVSPQQTRSPDLQQQLQITASAGTDHSFAKQSLIVTPGALQKQTVSAAMQERSVKADLKTQKIATFALGDIGNHQTKKHIERSFQGKRLANGSVLAKGMQRLICGLTSQETWQVLDSASESSITTSSSNCAAVFSIVTNK